MFQMVDNMKKCSEKLSSRDAFTRTLLLDYSVFNYGNSTKLLSEHRTNFSFNKIWCLSTKELSLLPKPSGEAILHNNFVYMRRGGEQFFSFLLNKCSID